MSGLYFYYNPLPLSAKPEIVEWEDKKEGGINSKNFQVRCLARGNPYVNITWHKINENDQDGVTKVSIYGILSTNRPLSRYAKSNQA